MIIELPPRQAEILTMIYKHTERNGFVPAIREMCEATGLSSTSTLHYHLTCLADRGLIQWAKGRNRAIQITNSGRTWLGVKLEKPKLAALRPVCPHCKGSGLAY